MDEDTGPTDPSSIVWLYHSHVGAYMTPGMMTRWTVKPQALPATPEAPASN